MSGRIKPFGWDLSGGMTEIATNSFGARPLRNKLLRLGPLESPTMLAVDLASETITPLTVATATRIRAEINWQSKRGTFTATIDVGRGAQFTVAAAETLDITAFLTTDVSANAAWRITGAAAPASGIAPVPARLTELPVTLATGVASADFTVPQFAHSFRVVSDDPVLSASIVAHCKITTGTTAYAVIAEGVDVPVLNGIHLVHLIFTGPAASTQSAILQWEIRL